MYLINFSSKTLLTVFVVTNSVKRVLKGHALSHTKGEIACVRKYNKNDRKNSLQHGLELNYSSTVANQLGLQILYCTRTAGTKHKTGVILFVVRPVL